MNIFTKHRFEIWNQAQHPYKHSLDEFFYSNPALPNGTNVLTALNALFAVIYPNTQDPVATVGDLPSVGNDLNDYRVVLDDGDGKAASYRWEQREGDAAPSWYKVFDMDWGEESILSNFLNKTQDVYVYKYGIGDLDENGDPITGVLAGQSIYGGDLANTNLTLFANSGDGTGPNTGFVQFGDQVRPTIDNSFDLGTSLDQFRTGYFGTSLLVNDFTISAGSILNSSGAISFGDENLTTTGNLDAGFLTTQSRIEMRNIVTPSNPASGFNSLYFKADGKLYRLDSSGTEKLVGLEFTSTNDNRLVKSDGTTGSAIQESGITVSDLNELAGVTSIDSGNLRILGNSIVSTDANGHINLTPNGTGRNILSNIRILELTSDRLVRVDANKDLISSGVVFNSSNAMSGLTALTVDNVNIDASTVSSVTGDLILNANSGTVEFNNTLKPIGDNSAVIGAPTERIANLYISNAFRDGTLEFRVPDLMQLRDANFRDIARTQPAQAGDALFYDAANNRWLASAPDSEISHSNLLLSSLANDDHLQYALLAGRSGGQSLIGGSDASDTLTLESTSNATKGSILTKDHFQPFTDASFSTVWEGTDLGGSTNYFRNLYTKGQLFGARVENVTNATIPSSSANNVGRIVFNQDTGKILVDNGTSFAASGINKHVEDLVFDGIELVKNVDVSANIGDARSAIIQLKDNANNFENIFVDIQATTASNVRIITSIPLVAGSYRLVVIE